MAGGMKAWAAAGPPASSATTARPARSSNPGQAVSPYPPVTCAGELRPRRMRSAASPTSTSTCSSSAAASPAPASRSTPRPAGCAPRSSSGATSRRARRRSRRSSCTAASATSSRRKSASSTKRSPSARSCARPRRTSCACCRSCSRCSPATACSPAASPACSARRCGCTTSPAGCASASCTSASSKEEALRYMPTLPADNVAASYVYYDAQTDDARLTLAVARTAADYGAAVANYATLVGVDEGRRRASVTRRARRGRRQRDRRARAASS